MKTIAERLKAARAKREWSQAQLAVAAGVSTGTIGNIESGARQSKGSLPQIAEALSISHKWLATGEGEMLVSVRKEDGHYLIGGKPQTDMPAPDPGSASATGMEIAHLYDLIPITDRVRRVKAYNAATKAILDVLEEQQPTGPGDDGSEK